MMRSRMLLLVIVAACASGCVCIRARQAQRLAMGFAGLAHVASRDTLYLTSTFRTLIEGQFEGEVPCGTLKQLGDVGLGAIDRLNGELILVDGVCYAARVDGSVQPAPDDTRTPYALVTPLEPDLTLDFRTSEAMDFDQLRRRLDERLGNLNLPWAFRIDGAFAYVKARSVPAQEPPYRRLVDVIETQREFEFNDVRGTIVGFRLPDHLESVGVPGYHFHFLTADRTGGGHLLAFRSNDLRVVADRATDVHVILPQNESFGQADLMRATEAEMNRIMGRTSRR